MRHTTIIFCLALLCAILSTSLSQAATYWVREDGPGSTTQACGNIDGASDPGTYRTTINSGLACLAAGDTLIIKAGTYEEKLTDVIPSGISDAQRTIVRAATGETVWLMPPTSGTVVWTIEIISRNFITLDGINTDGSNAIQSASLFIRNGSTFITAQNATLRDHGAPGSNQISCIGFNGIPGSNHKFINLELVNCGVDDGEHGIYLTSTDSLIERCRVYGSGSHGLHEYLGATAPRDNIIRYNTVYNNGYVGIGLYHSSGTVAYNNIVYGNGSDGIKTNATTLGIYNNTVYNNTGRGINFTDDTGHTARNNILYLNTVGGFSTTTGHTVSNNLTTNPFFANAGTADFHLTASSTGAINAGTNTAPINTLVTTDFDGTARPQGGTYDIGAYEFISGGDTTAPTVATRTPLPSAINVATSATVIVTFSEAMNAATITTSTILLQSPGSITVAASISYNAGTFTATLTPDSALTHSTVYTATVESGASGVKDSAGNALAADSVWTFTTIATVGPLTYHVAKTGHDTNNDCTEAQSASTPKLTINAGIDCLVGGDTLIIHAGNYDERIRENGLAIPSGISNEVRTIIQAATGEAVWITPTTDLGVFQIFGRSFITIDGINIDSVSAGATNSFGLIIGSGAQSITIQNLTIKNVRGTAGLADGAQTCLTTQQGDPGSGHRFINLDLENCGTGADEHGIFLASSTSVIENCRVRTSGAMGIYVAVGSEGSPNTNVIRKNVLYTNGEAGLSIAVGTGNQAYNNIVYGNGNDGIRLSGVNTLVYNNTVTANTDMGIVLTSATTNTLTNNIAYLNTVGQIGSTVGHTASNNLTTDPLFVNAATADFHLQSGSSAINAGISTSPTVTTDFDGTARPQGANYDIGAFEFSGTPLVPGGLFILGGGV